MFLTYDLLPIDTFSMNHDFRKVSIKRLYLSVASRDKTRVPLFCRPEVKALLSKAEWDLATLQISSWSPEHQSNLLLLIFFELGAPVVFHLQSPVLRLGPALQQPWQASPQTTESSVCSRECPGKWPWAEDTPEIFLRTQHGSEVQPQGLIITYVYNEEPCLNYHRFYFLWVLCPYLHLFTH